MNMGSGRMMANYGPDRANSSQFGSFYQGIPENMSGSMGQSYGQGYGHANQNSNYGQSQQILPSQQFYQNQNQHYQSQANQFQQIQVGQQGYLHGRFCQCNICSQSNMTQFLSPQASQRSRVNSNPAHSTQPFYRTNPKPHLNPPFNNPSHLPNKINQYLNNQDPPSNIQTHLPFQKKKKTPTPSIQSLTNSICSNHYPTKPNFLSETEASQNLDDQNLSEISNNCASNLSHKNAAKNDQNCYSPFNKSSWVLKDNKMPTVSNNVGL
jgi:hypothetical protein